MLIPLDRKIQFFGDDLIDHHPRIIPYFPKTKKLCRARKMDSAGRYGFMQISAHPAYTGSLLQRKLIDEADRSVGFKHLSRKQFVPEDGNERSVFAFGSANFRTIRMSSAWQTTMCTVHDEGYTKNPCTPACTPLRSTKNCGIIPAGLLFSRPARGMYPDQIRKGEEK